MKNVFQSAILVSLFLLSCSDEADRTENVTGTVGFHTADVTPSRAAVVGLPGLEDTGFRVSAYATGTEVWSVAKDNLNTKPGLMWNQLVEWDDVWTYTPAKYWPGLVDGTNYGNVSFFAWNEIFKNNPDVFSVSGASMAGPPQLTYTVPNTQSDQKDLVTAMATDKTVTGGDVSLTFGHVLSRIGFTAKLEDHYNDVTVTITSLKVKYKAGAVERKGIYTFGKTNPWSFPPTDKVYMSHTGDGDVVVGGAGVPLNNDFPTPTETDLTTAENYLMLLPQTVTDGDVTIEVTWTFDDGGGGGALTQTQPIPLPTQIWLPGKCYDYSLKVSLTGITLDPVLVNPWGETTLYQPCTITYKTPDGTDIVEYRTTNVSYLVGDYTFPSYPDFDGWNTKADGTGITYRAGDNIFCTEDLPLFAQWTGRTNCYMVKPGETVKFRVSRAYQDDGQANNITLRTGGDYTGDFEVAVLWDDNEVINESVLDVSGSGSNAVVIVETHNHSGNAVVKIYKAGDDTETPVWSYHIWVTDPAAIATWENTNQTAARYIFMDRNLGATEAALSLAGRGLFYQWGRKDPFPGGKSGTAGYAARNKFTGIDGNSKLVTGADYAGSTDKAAQIKASIQYPMVFFSAVSSGDWLSARENALWNVTSGSQRIKSIYDPCPSGWRVPEHVGNVGSTANSPWKGLTTEPYTSGDNGGATFKASGKIALYPAGGFRGINGGTWTSGDKNSYNWAASVNGTYNATNMVIEPTGKVFLIHGEVYRAYGFCVRCVKE